MLFLNWFERLIEWIKHKFFPTWGYYIFYGIVSFSLVYLLAWLLSLLLGWDNFPQTIVQEIAAITSIAYVYYLVVKDTGCPKYHYFLPFQRKEVGSTLQKQIERRVVIPRYDNQYFDHSISIDRERSWDEVKTRVYEVSKVQYVCKHCKYEWEEEREELLRTYVKEFEQPPQKYKPPFTSEP